MLVVDDGTMDTSTAPTVAAEHAAADGVRRVRLDALMACAILASVAIVESVRHLVAIGS
jgi:hypothetical protein